MKRVVVLSLFVALVLATAAFAANGKMNHLDLYAKDPGDWTIVAGMEGRLNYGPEMFVFNGHGLVAGTEYALISYDEPWPSTGLVLLGTGMANEYGDVHIMGEMLAPVCNEYDEEVFGAKIWLVPSDDLGAAGFIAWNPTEYLFEGELIPCWD